MPKPKPEPLHEPTLLEQALRMPAYSPLRPAVTPEEVELAIAWAHGRITMAQITKVRETKPGGNTIYVFLSHALAEAVRNGGDPGPHR